VTGLCAWCDSPIPAKARRDAMCCSVRLPRPGTGSFVPGGYADSVAPGHPLRLAYADPPYPGQSVAVQGSPGLRRGS